MVNSSEIHVACCGVAQELTTLRDVDTTAPRLKLSGTISTHVLDCKDALTAKNGTQFVGRGGGAVHPQI